MPDTAANPSHDTDLFEPVQVGPYRLANRIVMSAMTRNHSPDEIPGRLNAEYYAQRATAGLIIAESTAISEQGLGWRNSPGIYSAAQIEGWRGVTAAVHRAGGRIFLQLWHCGRGSHYRARPGNQLPVAPSALQSPGHIVTPNGREQCSMPRALDLAEIPGVIGQFRQAAANALAAGFDGVEIHAANGYLLDQFLQDATNHRADRYGGSIENRCRLLWEVAEAVTGVWGASRVGVHISPANVHHGISDREPDRLFGAVAEGLNRFGLAYLNVVEGATDPVDRELPFDWDRLRRLYRGTYIANNKFDLARAKEARRRNHADLISFGRLFIANPDLVERFRLGGPLNELNRAKISSPDHTGYTDYPFLSAR